MATKDPERQPLLGPAGYNGTNGAALSDRNYNNHPDELPASFNTTDEGVPCRVCRAIIKNVEMTNQHVVKCGACEEATPIRPAPAGRTYVRCPCNCLLVCRASSRHISCPRPHCKRVINRVHTPFVPVMPFPMPGKYHVTCGHCSNPNTTSDLHTAFKCPACKKISSIGAEFVRSRSVIFLLFGLLALGIGIGILVFTLKDTGYAEMLGAGIAASVVVFLIAAALLMRFLYYCLMKVSQVVETI
jgi:phosphatidylinositol-4,5-bisphosphate 4-phosphatase